jgi:hypothetical protein
VTYNPPVALFPGAAANSGVYDDGGAVLQEFPSVETRTASPPMVPGCRVARDWRRLQALPPAAAPDNFVRPSPPGAPRPREGGPSWRSFSAFNSSPTRGVFFDHLPDGPGRTALRRVNRPVEGRLDQVEMFTW